MKGIEFLRGIYMASGLNIKPKTRVNKIDALKEIMRAWGFNPEEILTRDALTRLSTTIIDQTKLQNHQLSQLTSAFCEQMLKEIRETQTGKSMNSRRAKVARERFELSSAGPKPAMLGHYTTGLQQSHSFCTSDLLSSSSLSLPRSNKRSHPYNSTANRSTILGTNKDDLTC